MLTKTGPTDHHCMTMITPEKVVKTCIDILGLEKNNKITSLKLFNHSSILTSLSKTVLPYEL